LTFRTAREADLDRLVEIHLAAYPSGRPAQARRSFAAHPLGGFDALVVAELDGDLVAHAFLFALETWFGGRAVKTGGIASVGVAPEVRGQGIARALLAELHRRSDLRGDAMTMLYPFRQAFYAALGYAPTSPRKRIVFDPRAVPDSWRVAARGSVRRARGEDREAVVTIHRRTAAAASGWSTRDEPMWNLLLSKEDRHVLLCEDGYVAFRLDQHEAHAKTIAYVVELVAATDAARRTLFGALATLRDQVAEVIVEVDVRDPIEHVLIDADARAFGTGAVEHSLGELVGGPMVRIEDAHRAIEARGYAADGAFDLVVEDDAMAMSVRVENGRAVVGPAKGGASMRLSRSALAGILYGGLTATDAARLGLAFAEARTLARIDGVVAMPPVAPVDAF
jgi:predicted acetyltransferase